MRGPIQTVTARELRQIVKQAHCPFLTASNSYRFKTGDKMAATAALRVRVPDDLTHKITVTDLMQKL